MAAAVDDPHIIPVYEAGEANGVLFIAMRYVPGGDVRTLVQREGAMPPARTAAIISPVASALDAAHAAGLVHRDVKPANMLVDVRSDRPDHVYLTDFWLSKGGGRAPPAIRTVCRPWHRTHLGTMPVIEDQITTPSAGIMPVMQVIETQRLDPGASRSPP